MGSQSRSIMNSSLFHVRLGADTSGISTAAAIAYLNLAIDPQPPEDSQEPQADEGKPPVDDAALNAQHHPIDNKLPITDSE